MLYLLWFLFIASALLLALIILIQEGKGGGLGEAFGGMGAETFGVKAAGVNKATATLAIIWVASAILINKCAYRGAGTEIFTESTTDEGSGGATVTGTPDDSEQPPK